jgi:hypothetical protein
LSGNESQELLNSDITWEQIDLIASDALYEP